VEALPTVSEPVHETFEVPLLSEVGAGAHAATASATRSAPVAAAKAKPVADAVGLFEDSPRKSPRRVLAAEARSKARRCPTCGGVVLAGMSLCSTCGLDLETGTRVALDDDLTPPPEPRGPALPLPVLVIGGIALLGSVVLAIVSISLWFRGFDGYQYFAPICLFGVFAAVQFLRLKTTRLLLMALTFGLAIDIVALIAMPIYRANNETGAVARTVAVDDPGKADLVIPSVVDKLDTQSLSIGIGLIFVYAAVSIYLMSPPVRRHFR
jgi:hypothetical protein